MEFIEGITLKEYIKANKVIEPMEAARIALQVAFALQHAHEKGIIHRDVKPHNIMLDTDGTIRLTDFGIARTVSEATRTTQHGKDMIGTVYYISPEQVQGKDVDDRTDIYSLGVVLYEMVTGRVPFDGDTSVNTVSYTHLRAGGHRGMLEQSREMGRCCASGKSDSKSYGTGWQGAYL